MGINKNTLRMFNEALLRINPYKSRLALMGNLNLREDSVQKANDYFRLEWKEVLSFDLKEKADIIVDLCIPIDSKYHGYFDALINGGTGEHVANQNMFFDNCDLMVKRGGILLHVAPEVGSFPNHCEYYYDEEYFMRYAKTYGYTMLDIERIKHRQGWAIYSVYLK